MARLLAGVWVFVAMLGGCGAVKDDGHRVGGSVRGLWDGADGVVLQLEADGTNTLLTAAGSPRLGRPDSFVAFVPGFMNYDRHRGSTRDRHTFQVFGVTTTTVHFLMDTQHDDLPDMKYRARLTLSENNPLQNPLGDIKISGSVFERVEDGDGDPETYNIVEIPESDTLHFSTNMTVTSNKYFDKLTSAETQNGLGINTTLDVEWWNGHEQEIDISVPVDNVTTETECEDGYRVYFNGKETRPRWDSTAKKCAAGLSASTAASGYRGMYFGIDRDEDERDAYHHFFDDLGHVAPGTTWEQWLGSLSVGKTLYEIEDDTLETRIRPIVVELERQSDLAVVDTARTLVNLEQSALGRPFLVRMTPATDVTGTIAQLSPRGLDHLEGTHVETLPYPITPAGTQPRLSQSAIALPSRTSNEVVVKLENLDTDDLDYWTKDNPDGGGEFAGFVAYEAILAAANDTLTGFNRTMDGCKLLPPQAQPFCEAAARAAYCVQSEPKAKDFRLRIAGVDTYFDPKRTQDALVIGDVTNLDLSFGNTTIRSNFQLENIDGWLEAWLDPARIQIEYMSNIPLCTIGPSPHLVSDYVAGTSDYNDWLTCRDLELDAALGTIAAPLEFGLTSILESLDTLPPAAPIVALFGVTENHAHGTCAKSWLGGVVAVELLAWQTDVAAAISTDLATSPAEDEALNRLLAPFELGVEAVDTPPTGTPPYSIHPLPDYAMSATIAATPLDLRGMFADGTHGLYVPYITRMTADTGVATYDSWMCPTGVNQACTVNPDAHQLMLLSGRDPNNAFFDVSLTYSTAHINQALWTQAARPERLGSSTNYARLAIADTELRQRASTMGFSNVVTALDALGGRFGIRFRQDAAPYVIATDAGNKLLYVTPNIVVEIVTTTATGSETVVAKMLYDIVDRDHHLQFSTAGKPTLSASWGDKEVISLTSTFLPSCYGTQGAAGGCDRQLRTVVDALLLPVVEPRLLEMIANAPGLHRFDAGQESIDPRQLRNVRTFVRPQGVVLVADLCDPDDPTCD